eukprot:sb/3478760/
MNVKRHNEKEQLLLRVGYTLQLCVLRNVHIARKKDREGIDIEGSIYQRKHTIELYNTVQSDPDLVPPDLVTPRFSDRINFPRYRKVTVFDPDLVPSPI